LRLSPGTQTALVGVDGVHAARQVALDGTGDMFIAENLNNQVVELPAGGGAQTTVGTGLSGPYGVALDGAGDIFIADTGHSRVVEVPAGCTNAACQITVGSGLSSPYGLAVDGAGDLFIADFGNSRVVEVPAGGGPQTTVGSGLGNPLGVAVDGAGDVFVVNGSQVVEVPPGCTSTACQTTVATGLAEASGVTVDAAGDVFIADTFNSRVVEVPAGGGPQTTVGSGFGYPYGVAVDGAGDVFITDTNDGEIAEVNRSHVPSLSFASTTVGNTSPDSPQVVSIENIGNTALDFSAIAYPTDFPEAPGETTDCLTANILNAGGICTLSIDFMPTTSGMLIESVGLTDNALNGTGATQSISVTGSGLSPEVNVPNLVGQTLAGATTLLGSALDLGAVTYQASTVPIGEVISQIPAANTQALVGSSVSVVISSGVAVPSVVGQTESAAEGSEGSITLAGLTVGTVTTQYSDTVPSGTVISQSPNPGTAVNGGTPVSLVVSNGVPPASDQLTLENNYSVTGDYASAGVTLREAPIVNGMATSAITIPSGTSPGSVPDGADIIDGFLYWTTIEPSGTSPSGNTGTFLGYSITGQQIGSDVPNYSDGTNTGILRVYRADVNTYFQVPAGWNGARLGSGSFSVTLPNSNGIVTEGASLVVIWRVLSPNFPLKSVVIYDGSIVPASLNVGPIPQAVQGFYDSAVLPNVAGENTILSTSGGSWNNGSGSVTLPVHSNQYIETLTAGNQTLGTGNAYAAVILSTPVSNSDNDGILDAWKAGPPAGDPNYGNPGYYDAKTGSWVPLPGATHGEQDLFVQFDYMCSALTGNACDFTQPNLYPSPDAQGNDPLAMVTQAYANIGVHLHLVPGNAILETTCTDTGTNPSQLCMFPNEPGVVTWDGSVQLSKVLPANYVGCTANPSAANCAPRFPYGQKDSYHYVLFGYSVAIPSWTTRSGSITSITVSGGRIERNDPRYHRPRNDLPNSHHDFRRAGKPEPQRDIRNLTCDSGLTTDVNSKRGPAWTWTYPNTNNG
jgi:sugar lactone lactonase YvrE